MTAFFVPLTHFAVGIQGQNPIINKETDGVKHLVTIKVATLRHHLTYWPRRLAHHAHQCIFKQLIINGFRMFFKTNIAPPARLRFSFVEIAQQLHTATLIAVVHKIDDRLHSQISLALAVVVVLLRQVKMLGINKFRQEKHQRLVVARNVGQEMVSVEFL